MHDEPRTDALAIGIECEKLHPARIDADERFVGGRWQTGHGPVVPLSFARDGNAVPAIGPENLQGFLCLRPAEQFLKSRDVFEPQFWGIRTLLVIAQDHLVPYPIALLL